LDDCRKWIAPAVEKGYSVSPLGKKFGVPHPRRVLVFAARVGYIHSLKQQEKCSNPRVGRWHELNKQETHFIAPMLQQECALIKARQPAEALES
jgi:hypothetical protein